MTVVIEGNAIPDREALHDFLAFAFSLPAWYGRNLDALYDCLTDVKELTVLMVCHTEKLSHNLGDYGDAFLATLQDAALNNPRLILVM